VHSLPIALALGAIHLPQDVATEQTHLVLELTEAVLLRVVSIAGRQHGANVLGPDRWSVDENLDRTSALARTLSCALAVRRMRGEVGRAERSIAGAPCHVAARGTNRVEKLPLA
jgi:hypothetical protein